MSRKDSDDYRSALLYNLNGDEPHAHGENIGNPKGTIINMVGTSQELMESAWIWGEHEEHEGMNMYEVECQRTWT